MHQRRLPSPPQDEAAEQAVRTLFQHPTTQNAVQLFDVAERSGYDMRDALAAALAEGIEQVTHAPSVLDMNAAVRDPRQMVDGKERVWVYGKNIGHASIEADPQLAQALRCGDQVGLRQTLTGPKLTHRMGVWPASDVCRFESRLSGGMMLVSQEGGGEHIVTPAYELSSDGADLKPGDDLECDLGVGLALRKFRDRQRVPVGHILATQERGLEALGGQPEAKRKLKHLVRLFTMSADAAGRLKLARSKFVLLKGPPGTGKTLCVGPLAGEFQRLGMNPIVNYLKGPEVRSKWVGETERQLREFKAESLEMAATHRPVIAVLDEFDSLILSRDRFSFSSEVGLMTVDTILSEFGGLDSTESQMENVIVVGISNKADTGLVDHAALREGRFSYVVNFTTMGRETDVLEVALIHIGERALDDGLTPEVAAERLAAHAFNGREGKGIPLVSVRMHDGHRELVTSRQVLTGALVAGAVTRAAERALMRGSLGSEYSISLADLFAGVDAALRDLSAKFSHSSLAEYLGWPPDKLARVVEVVPVAA